MSLSTGDSPAQAICCNGINATGSLGPAILTIAQTLSAFGDTNVLTTNAVLSLVRFPIGISQTSQNVISPDIVDFQVVFCQALFNEP